MPPSSSPPGSPARTGCGRRCSMRRSPTLFRIIGPNTVGLMIPPLKLNAELRAYGGEARQHRPALPVGRHRDSLIDWAADNNVGFSHIVSLGDMADVDVGDWLDLLAGEPKTRAIVMYLETIPNPRKFMSAARAAARMKPVIAIKAGRHAGGRQGGRDAYRRARRRGPRGRSGVAARRHTAASTGLPSYSMRSKRLRDFRAAGAGAGRHRHQWRRRRACWQSTSCIDRGGELAELSAATIARLDASLPPTWSHANPVDIIGDAPPERYSAAVEAVAADAGRRCRAGAELPDGAWPRRPRRQRRWRRWPSAGRIGGQAGADLLAWRATARAKAAASCTTPASPASRRRPMRPPRSRYLSDWSRAQKALMRVPSIRSEDVPGDAKRCGQSFARRRRKAGAC